MASVTDESERRINELKKYNEQRRARDVEYEKWPEMLRDGPQKVRMRRNADELQQKEKELERDAEGAGRAEGVAGRSGETRGGGGRVRSCRSRGAGDGARDSTSLRAEESQRRSKNS